MSMNIRKVIICISNGKLYGPKCKWCWGLSCIYIITTFVASSLCDQFTYHVLYDQWTRHTKPKMKKWTRHMSRVHWFLFGQVVHIYVPLLLSITWHRSKDGDVLRLGRWPQSWRKVMAAYKPPGNDLKSNLRTECLYTGISSRPSAR